MSVEISVIVYQQGPDQWIAQGLEYDIVAEAQSLNELPGRFVAKVTAEIAVSLDLGIEPLAGLEAAPEPFWKMFKDATLTVQSDPLPARIANRAHAPRILPRMKLGNPAAHLPAA